MVNIAVMGYGTVGSGVVEVINTNGDIINQRAADQINIKYVLDLRDFPGDPIQEKIVHDVDVIINDPEIRIVVEVMGGVEPAYTFVKSCLEAGKSVVTSNKALVAKHGAELLSIARDRELNFLFEASVGGGIPIIRALNSSLTADKIEEITGILNGTTNYMLSKMFYEGADYADVLKEAQQNGFAEADACRKIAILSCLISGQQVDFEDIYTEGITEITKEDMMYAKEMDMTVKLLASSKRHGDHLHAIVAPALLGKEHPLYNVNGVFNAVFVTGNMLGDAMFYGSGAGKHLHRNIMTMWKNEKLTLLPIEDTCKRFFVRLQGGENERRAEIENIFGGVQFLTVDGLENEFGIVTPEMTEREYRQKSEQLSGVIRMIRLEE